MKLIALKAVGLTLIAFLLIRYRDEPDHRQRAFFRDQKESLLSVARAVASDTNLLIVRRHSQSPTKLLRTDTMGQTTALFVTNQVDAELRHLFDVLDCEYILRDKDEIVVGLAGSKLAWLHPGGKKVLAFRSNSLPLLVDSIDDFRRKHRGKYDVYSPLESHWYIKFVEVH